MDRGIEGKGSSIRSTVFQPTEGNDTAGRTLLAGGGLLGAVAMSSCCIAPLVLFSLGVTGAWIGNLATLYPYQPYFFVATAGFLAAGFYRTYRKRDAASFETGSTCVSPLSDRFNKVVLWSATVLVLAALAFPYVAPSLLKT